MMDPAPGIAQGGIPGIRDTFGALFIGALVTMAVYGITTLQTYLYYMTFHKDGAPMKLLVGTVWTLDTLHIIFMCHTMYYYLVTSFGKPSALVDGTWSLFASVLINAMIAFVVQCFFAQKIYQLCSPSRRKWVVGGIMTLVIVHFGFAIETVYFLFKQKAFARLNEVSMICVVPFGISATLSDIAIAGTLVALLDNNRSIFQDTNSIINRLIIFAINRCILTSAMAIVETIVFSVMPNSFYSIAIDFVIGKLYANSLLAVLNSRATLRHELRLEAEEDISTGFRAASGVTQFQTTSILVRSRESGTREESSSADCEKGGIRMYSGNGHGRE